MPNAPQNLLPPQESSDSPKLIGAQLGHPGLLGVAINVGADQLVPLYVNTSPNPLPAKQNVADAQETVTSAWRELIV